MMAVGKEEALSMDATNTFSAAVKRPMRNTSQAPNQTRFLRLDALGCSIVRVNAAKNNASLVEVLRVGIRRQTSQLTESLHALAFNRVLPRTDTK